MHFVAEVWLELTGQDISVITRFFEDTNSINIFERVREPVDPCIVLLRAPRLAIHAGVYLRKKVLHLDNKGAQFFPLHVVGFHYPNKRFYICRQSESF